MILIGFLYLFIFVQDEIPFKPKDEFEVKLNYAFKQRPAVEHSSYSYDTQTKNPENSSNILPYLMLKLKVVTTTGLEVKLKVTSNRNANILTKKIQGGIEFPIDIGFTDDVKDRVTAHQYIVYFLDDKKKEQSKIVIFVEEDGTFLINGEIRGKL